MKLKHVVAFVCFMAVATWAGTAESEYQFSFGGGLADGGVEFDSERYSVNGERSSDGVFFVWRAVCNEDGATLELSISDTGTKTKLGSSFLKTKFQRFGFDVGYTFNRAGEFRPFVTGGFAYLNTKVTMGAPGISMPIIDDGSMGATVSIGIEMGVEGSTFYAKILRDFGHRVHPEWLDAPLGRTGLDFEQFRIGYVYRY